jgi:S-formylglutathione hydrolase FrmB
MYGGDAAQWAAFDPATVMRAHGPYRGVSGWFEDTAKPTTSESDSPKFGDRPQPNTPLGFGGHDDWHDADEAGAAQDLCAVGTAVGISCSVHTLVSFHTWQFAAQAFSDALPWIAGQIQTPQVESSAR